MPRKNPNRRKDASRCSLLASKTNPKRIKKVLLSITPNLLRDSSPSQRNSYLMAKRNFLYSNRSGRNSQAIPLRDMARIGTKSVFRAEILLLICVALECSRSFSGLSSSKTIKSKTTIIKTSQIVCWMEHWERISSGFDSHQNNRHLFITNRKGRDKRIELVWLPAKLQLNDHLHLQKTEELIQRGRHSGHPRLIIGQEYKKIIRERSVALQPITQKMILFNFIMRQLAIDYNNLPFYKLLTTKSPYSN